MSLYRWSSSSQQNSSRTRKEGGAGATRQISGWRIEIIMVSSRRTLMAVWALLVFCLLNGFYWHANAQTNANDVATLQQLYKYWADQSGSNMPSNWQGDPCGSNWQGITCDQSQNNVVELSLPNLKITGGIPSTIEGLASLHKLDLSLNAQLGGAIPTELAKLTNLTYLQLMGCGITGGIPAELGKLVNLQYLAINDNSLSGPIPAELGNLKQMYWFDISENSLSGTLPLSTSTSPGLDNLVSAIHFHFYSNSLNGTIPQQIFNLPQIQHLLLYANQFSGSIPSGHLSNANDTLQLLRLDNNRLTGPIPEGLNALTNLTELGLGHNQLRSTIPNLPALTNLQLLDVSYNSFESEGIPDWIYTLQSAQTILLDSANLNGPLNSSIFSLPSLQLLSASDNALSGSINMAGISSSLTTINLQNNNFTQLVASSANLPLQLYGNSEACLQWTNTTYCSQGINGPFSWKASPPLSSCHQTCGDQTLNPNSCGCSYPLICQMELFSPSFQSVNDSFMASISTQVANDFQLQPNQVFISSANFTTDGKMDFTIFFFPLPGQSLNSTEVVTIVNTLSAVNVSIAGTPYRLVTYSIPPTSSGKSSKSSTGLIIGVVVAVILAVLIIGIVAFYAIRQKRRADRAVVSRPFASWGMFSKKETGGAPQLKGARWFSLPELIKATNNFSERNELGAGGYGKVYRGELLDGLVVAVKRADSGSLQGAAEFKNEIELLSRVHHKNLVGLVGFCYENGEQCLEQCLVYECLPNGTLRDHLLGLGQFDVPLAWEKRVEIALGSARGLAYLHELANPPIIHRDIKSGNILLDENMVAKVADFGLSKLAPEGPDKQDMSVKGTLGYLDPEYYTTNRLSEKSDVYSFGVVLLEMLSARTPIQHGRYIVREVRNALDRGGFKALEPLLDPFLEHYPAKQLEEFLDLALECVEEVGARRPAMNEVVKRLEVIAGDSQPKAGNIITVEPQKVVDDVYGDANLGRNIDPSFQYSGLSFRADTKIEPK